MRARHPALRIVASVALLGGLVESAPVHSEEWAAAAPATLASDAARVELGRWRWPVEGDRQVLRDFVAPVHPWSAGHRGVDLRAWTTELRAPAEGVVRYAGWVVDRPVLSIDHGGAVSSYEPVTASVAIGDEVAAGQPIGTIEPGHCEARCVHLGVRVGGEYRNPLLWLGGVPRSVLLPTRALGWPGPGQ